jgi:deoxyribodipyrimidine photo-lyase
LAWRSAWSAALILPPSTGIRGPSAPESPDDAEQTQSGSAMNSMPDLAFEAASIPAPTRAAALERLAAFAPHGIREYAWRRNTDPGPGAESTVSRLSPHVRHRLVLESELVAAALKAHPGPASDKFVQEVFWRSYWKGWLELRPGVWRSYRRSLDERLDEAQRGYLARAYADACAGRTGIDCFDAWVQELVTTGYLHNHTRMWFASIWSHTLRLPWELGAEFFLRHLLDGDAASNTLSWRWVVGLQTPGKTYLARPDNIAKYTNGRWSPRGLATHAEPAPAAPLPSAGSLPPADAPPAGPAVLLLHEDDLHPESLGLSREKIVAIGVLDSTAGRSPREVSALVRDFTAAAQQDACVRNRAEPRTTFDARELVERCVQDGVKSVVTAYAPVGPARDRLDELEPALRAEGIALHRVRREWDDATWPHAKRGFFAFAEHIPDLLAYAR